MFRFSRPRSARPGRTCAFPAGAGARSDGERRRLQDCTLRFARYRGRLTFTTKRKLLADERAAKKLALSDPPDIAADPDTDPSLSEKPPATMAHEMRYGEGRDDVMYAAENPAEDSSSDEDVDGDGYARPGPVERYEHRREDSARPGGEWKGSEEDERRAAFQESLRSGMQVDLLDSVSRWSEAEVLDVDHERQRVYCTYMYWSDRFDEWVPIASARLAEAGTMTYQEGGRLVVGHRIEAGDRSARNGKLVWREAFVIACEEDSVKVHYKGYSEKFDEWFPRGSELLRPYGRMKAVAQEKQRARRRRQLLSNNTAEHSRKRTIAAVSSCYGQYVQALDKEHLRIVAVEGDGNCLFRSVSHQIYGDDAYHALVRAACCNYMEAEASFFEQFVEGNREDFMHYVAMKRRNAVWGDDPEVQAMCEIYDRPAEIWAYDHRTGARKLRTFHESPNGDVAHTGEPMRLSYYGGGHYDSLVRAPAAASPGGGRAEAGPGAARAARHAALAPARPRVAPGGRDRDEQGGGGGAGPGARGEPPGL